MMLADSCFFNEVVLFREFVCKGRVRVIAVVVIVDDGDILLATACAEVDDFTVIWEFVNRLKHNKEYYYKIY